MVSRYMVLFGIIYLGLDIFITWWMSIFQRIVVLRHISVCFPSHTGAYPFPREHQTFHKLHSPFDLVVDPYKLHIRAYPHSLGSSDLSQTLVSFDLVVDPHELSYWGISPPFESACIVILVSSDFGPLDQIIVHFSFSRLHLYRSVICLSVSVFWDRTYIDW